jgi:hypothetical protein
MIAKVKDSDSKIGVDMPGDNPLKRSTLTLNPYETPIAGRQVDPINGRVQHAVKRRKLRGGYSEIVATAWLLENGFEVFRNAVDKGLIDIIAIGGGHTILIDVKTANLAPATGGRWTVSGGTLSKEQVGKGIVPLYVTDEGICGWSTREIGEKINGN